MDADELYRRAPEEFTAARDAVARARRAEGDRDGAAALRALRRPSVAAWLVNRLAQDEPELLGSLLDLGPELASAQSGGDAAALRALGAQRRELVDAVTATAVARAGRTVSAAVRTEVQSTLDAALSDPASAAAVRSGRLVRALSYAGLGEVDLDGAVAPASRRHFPRRASAAGGGRQERSTRERDRAARAAAAEAAAQAAAGRLDDAVGACQAAEQTLAAAATTAEELAAEVARLAQQLAQAEQASAAATDRVHAARNDVQRARAEVERAQTDAERAREQLDRARRGGQVSGR